MKIEDDDVTACPDRDCVADLNRGLAYEDVVESWFIAHKIPVRRCKGIQEQCEIGDLILIESGEGIEVKFDDRIVKTGRLFLETEERWRKTEPWKPAGIYSRSRARWFWIGDRDEFWFFERERLKLLSVTKTPIPNKYDTAKGILITRIEGFDLAQNHGALTGAGNLRRLRDIGRALGNQYELFP